MPTFLLIALIALAAAAVVPAACLLALTLAAGRQRKLPNLAASRERPVVAVLVPAHNESRHILPTLESLRLQLSPGDTLLVVADNCTDDTAAVAQAAGVRVLERHCDGLRGKGYALDAGVRHLKQDGRYDVLVIIDADCTLEPGSIRRIAAECVASQRPMQMLNMMHAPAGASVRVRVLEFAWVMKNLVRPLGMKRLGGACHLTGTGMALPWSIAAAAKLATGHVAEDMQLGVELALGGQPAIFSTSGTVRSEFPTDVAVARVQKTRWEHGTLAVLGKMLPRLAHAAVRRRSRALGAMAMDLAVPPIALYTATLVGLWAVALPLHWTALWPAAAVLDAGLAALVASILLGWLRHGRHLLHAREMLAMVAYLAWKLPGYVGLALRRRVGWVRTARS
jgi:cellulose synthase/poly-beta-1,6-N-acetylglucosamine synthase-like glycosyltransferase